MIELLHRYIIPAAYSVLPPQMASDRATAMLVAIALQESKLEHRTQVRGPARGFYQFERSGGIAGVLAHPRSSGPIGAALETLRYRASGDECYRAVADNDVLATCFARCLLWTLPGALPSPLDAEGGWQTYLAGWRPGKPHRTSWNSFYRHAWGLVNASRKEIQAGVAAAGASMNLPNMLPVVEEVAREHPLAFRRCNREDVSRDDKIAFAKLVVRRLNDLGDASFGLNGKRGDKNNPSMDAISYLKGDNPADVYVVDIVDSSGTLDDDGVFHPKSPEDRPSKPTWNDVSHAGPGYFIPLEGDAPLPKPQPNPTPPPPMRPGDDAAYATLQWFRDTYDEIVAAPPEKRPTLSRDEIIAALKNLRDACDRLLEARLAG